MSQKVAILTSLTAILIALAAFLILNDYSGTQEPQWPSFNANDQALSNGLIGIDKKKLPEANSRAVELYDSACAFCHELPDPESHDAMEWEFVVDRMEELIVELKEREKRVDVPWNSEIKKEILAYLERYAFQGMNPDDLPDSPEKGAKIFKEVCAACHTLHNPSMHSLLVWEYVISKMQHFQKDMGMPFMTEGEVEALLEYLSQTQ